MKCNTFASPQAEGAEGTSSALCQAVGAELRLHEMWNAGRLTEILGAAIDVLLLGECGCVGKAIGEMAREFGGCVR